MKSESVRHGFGLLFDFCIVVNICILAAFLLKCWFQTRGKSFFSAFERSCGGANLSALKKLFIMAHC
jgi:hypothetical protein